MNESNRMECKGDDGMVCENDGIVCECERGWGVKVGEDDGMVFGGGEGWCVKGMGCLVCIF